MTRFGVPADTFDARAYSSISFRKGCGSALSAGGVDMLRVMDHMDHRQLASTRHYVADTVASRAANSAIMATGFPFEADMQRAL